MESELPTKGAKLLHRELWASFTNQHTDSTESAAVLEYWGEVSCPPATRSGSSVSLQDTRTRKPKKSCEANSCSWSKDHDPNRMVLWPHYRAILAAGLLHAHAPLRRVLVLGLGAAIMPSFIKLVSSPTTALDVVEVSPGVRDAAAACFGFQGSFPSPPTQAWTLPGQSSVYVDSAETYIAGINAPPSSSPHPQHPHPRPGIKYAEENGCRNRRREVMRSGGRYELFSHIRTANK